MDLFGQCCCGCYQFIVLGGGDLLEIDECFGIYLNGDERLWNCCEMNVDWYLLVWIVIVVDDVWGVYVVGRLVSGGS